MIVYTSLKLKYFISLFILLLFCCSQNDTIYPRLDLAKAQACPQASKKHLVVDKIVFRSEERNELYSISFSWNEKALLADFTFEIYDKRDGSVIKRILNKLSYSILSHLPTHLTTCESLNGKKYNKWKSYSIVDDSKNNMFGLQAYTRKAFSPLFGSYNSNHFDFNSKDQLQSINFLEIIEGKLLRNPLLMNFSYSNHTGDLERISFDDKSLDAYQCNLSGYSSSTFANPFLCFERETRNVLASFMGFLNYPFSCNSLCSKYPEFQLSLSFSFFLSTSDYFAKYRQYNLDKLNKKENTDFLIYQLLDYKELERPWDGKYFMKVRRTMISELCLNTCYYDVFFSEYSSDN